MSLPAMLDVFQDVLSRLETASIPYMVVGSLSAVVYGEPRMTKDIVIDIQAKDISKIELLFPIEGFYCPPPEVLKAEVISRVYAKDWGSRTFVSRNRLLLGF